MKKFFEIKPDFFVRLDSIKKVEVVNGCLVIIHYSDDRKDEIQCANEKQSQFLNNLFSALEGETVNDISIYDSIEPVWYRRSIKNVFNELKQTYPDAATRLYHGCVAKSIKTIGDLVRYGRNNFRAIRGVGERQEYLLATYLKQKYNFDWQ